MDWRVKEEEPGLDLADIDIVPDIDVPWMMGVYWDEPVNQPIRLIIDSESGTDMPDAFLVSIPLFSDHLLNILNSAGVDNIQTYDVLITDPRDNHVYNNYKAVNIVGLVSCANLKKSKYIEGSGPPLMYFEHLVINENLVDGLQLFRLAEASEIILVEEKIAKQLMDNDLVGIRLAPVESN